MNRQADQFGLGSRVKTIILSLKPSLIIQSPLLPISPSLFPPYPSSASFLFLFLPRRGRSQRSHRPERTKPNDQNDRLSWRPTPAGRHYSYINRLDKQARLSRRLGFPPLGHRDPAGRRFVPLQKQSNQANGSTEGAESPVNGAFH